MIAIIFGIAMVLAWLAAALLAIVRLFENGILDLIGWACACVAVVGLAWVLNESYKNEIRHPCVTYESRMTYNAATKTMMPLRVCVERGEWEQTE